jgi:type 1 glutamine amidotransferase
MNRKNILAFIVFISAGLISSAFMGSSEFSLKKKKIKVLIIDGANNHDWPRATKIIKDILEDSDLFTVEVSTTPAVDAAKEQWDKWHPKFKQYDVVFSNFNGGHQQNALQWPKEVEQDLEQFVSQGGGFVSYHAANNSFPSWENYNKMIALGWRDKSYGPSFIIDAKGDVIKIPTGEGRNPGHGPEHDFVITVKETDHPIYKGVPKHWKHPHEQLTHGQHGPGGMKILSSAWSKDTNENEPMDWTVNYGKGRVYTTMLGHLWKDGPDTSMKCIGFQTILIRGTEWAASGKVSYPIPKNFPTENEVSVRNN